MYYPDWEYVEIGIKPDHVHLYMVIPPEIRGQYDNRDYQEKYQ